MPLYCPGGLASRLPTVSVPPILTNVLAGGVAVAIKGVPVLEEPIVTVSVPPLLPVSTAGGPFTICISVPGLASTSNTAGAKVNPICNSTTLPVLLREPLGDTVTVPPAIPVEKAPKRNPCAGFTNMEIGRGGGCCAFTSTLASNPANSKMQKTDPFMLLLMRHKHFLSPQAFVRLETYQVYTAAECCAKLFYPGTCHLLPEHHLSRHICYC